MGKFTSNINNYILNKSNRYRHYESENIQLKGDIKRLKDGLLTSQNEFDLTIETFKNDNQKLLKKIEELSMDYSILKGRYDLLTEDNTQTNYNTDPNTMENCQPKRLEEICTSHTRNNLDNVTIGEYTYGNPKIECWAPNDKLTIGKFCSIASNVTILIGMHHCISCGSTFPFCAIMGISPPNVEIEQATHEETIIGNDVWIGYDVLILSGVTIGDGAVIGAGAVVSKDVEPYSIVAGSPLRHLRYRFPKDVIKVLLEKKWWDLPDKKIEELVPYLIQTDIYKLVEKLETI